MTHILTERNDIKNRLGMEELTKVLASSTGSLLNPQNIADTFKSSGQGISAPTTNEYLRYLKEAFMVEKAERYDIKGRKYTGIPAKYYYSDPGPRNII